MIELHGLFFLFRLLVLQLRSLTSYHINNKFGSSLSHGHQNEFGGPEVEVGIALASITTRILNVNVSCSVVMN